MILGKLLVFLNLIVGLAMLSWAVGLYTQKLNWLDHTSAEGEKVEGEITQLKAEIDQLTLEARIASQGWGLAYEALGDAEKSRDDRQKAFDQRLVWARTGNRMAMGGGFFRDEFLPGSGLIDTDKLGAPIKGPDGNPLRGAETLTQTIEANNQATKTALDAINKLRLEQQQLQKDEKLLQAKVDRQAVFYDNLANEIRYLEAFEINWYEQLGTVQRRKAQLTKRLSEFQQ